MSQSRRNLSLGHRATHGMCRIVLIGLALALLAGCGGANGQSETGDGSPDDIPKASTAELERVDEDLDALEVRHEKLLARVDALQDEVVEYMGPGESVGDLSLGDESTNIEIDRNGVIRVNGISMTRDEFSTLVETRAKDICKPTPQLMSHPSANTDVVVWVMERIYAEGCGSIDVVDPSDRE